MADGDNITWQNLGPLLSGGQQTTQQQTQQPNAAAATNFDAKTQTSLNSLQPDFADRAVQWIQGMRDQGYNPVLHFGYRSPQEQQVLYQNHLAGGPQAVAPPMSYHTYGRAFDWVNQNAKTGNLEWNNDAAYEFGKKLAKQYGLTGISGSDNDHIQDANYASWKDLPREEYGNIRPRQVAQANTGTTAAPATAQAVAATQAGGTYGGVTWQDLRSLLQR